MEAREEKGKEHLVGAEMPCDETDGKCKATKTELIADGHDKYGNCRNPKCDHPVLNHTDSSAAGVSLSHFVPFLCTLVLPKVLYAVC